MNLDPFYSYNPPSLPFEQRLSVLFTSAWYGENQFGAFLDTHELPCKHMCPPYNYLWLNTSLFASLCLCI